MSAQRPRRGSRGDAQPREDQPVVTWANACVCVDSAKCTALRSQHRLGNKDVRLASDPAIAEQQLRFLGHDDESVRSTLEEQESGVVFRIATAPHFYAGDRKVSGCETLGERRRRGINQFTEPRGAKTKGRTGPIMY
jgi:hypothetical protein